ncbi:MAG: hypothetical protein ILO53_00240 [Clostridia bacterium]|nr:hypothetical protein [Clostridia bacterium]
MIFISCNKADENSQRHVARDYLVIPQNRRVYIISRGDASDREIINICNDIVATENHDFVVYVLVPRDGELKEALRNAFPGNSSVRPVVAGRKTEVYLNAADVILTKANIARREGPSDNIPKASMTQRISAAYFSAYRSAKEAIKAARLFLDGKALPAKTGSKAAHLLKFIK